MISKELEYTLWEAVQLYKNSSFISDDPIQIPHLFNNPRDIELAAFFTAIISWGQRKTIINNAKRMMEIMDYSPYDFILNSSPSEQQSITQFKHRTFNGEDFMFLIIRLRKLLKQHHTLENVFFNSIKKDSRILTVESALINFRHLIFSDGENRTTKHIASPLKNSACKRLNMFLRWMVRKDEIDFGVWKAISPSELLMPLDIHVVNSTKKLSILPNLKSNWHGCNELTQLFKNIYPEDPIIFDFALFGLGVEKQGCKGS